MAITVFYSWQNDCPNSTNRTFIEDALKKAIQEVSTNISIENAERNETLALDKDTQNVPGTPPITDVIFQKISGAAIFVPDLTFVGKAENNRLIPNPNVLIEYGYAIRALGYSKIIPIMNTAYGKMTPENLPFNMRHLRHPIIYKLEKSAVPEDKTKVKAELVKQLEAAIALILKAHPPEAAQNALEHVAIPSTEDPSTFLKKGESLGFIGGGFRPEHELAVPDNEHLFLRVLPKIPTEEIGSSQKVLTLLEKNPIWPFADQQCAFSRGRNKYGAFTVAHDRDKVLSLTQVFHNREIWGIDAATIDKKGLMDWMNVEFGYFPCSTLEESFIFTFSSYLPFCRDFLKLPLPLKFIAGATKVEGYRMTAPNGIRFGGINQFGGRVVKEHLIYEGSIIDFNSDAKILLRPFFEKIWDECGLKRPDREQL